MKFGVGFDIIVQINLFVFVYYCDKVVQYIEGVCCVGFMFFVGGMLVDDLFGYYVKLVVIVDLYLDSVIVCDEVFGLVIVVVLFDDVVDVVCFVNVLLYGFVVSVWSNDLKCVMNFVLQIEVGMVWVNCYILFDLLMLFGGYK